MQEEDDYYFEDDPDYKSKTQVKEEMHALRQLGVELAELPLSVLDTLELSTELRAAIDDYRRIGHKNALKRQASFIGKLMRREDSDAIRAQLDAHQESRHRATRQFHLVEQWRDKLVSGDLNELEAFFAEFPHSDRQQLRSLVRSLAKEKSKKTQTDTKQSPKATATARKIFKFIQEAMAAAN